MELDVISPERGGGVHWASHGAETNFVFGRTFGPDGVGPPNRWTNCSFDQQATPSPQPSPLPQSPGWFCTCSLFGS